MQNQRLIAVAKPSLKSKWKHETWMLVALISCLSLLFFNSFASATQQDRFQPQDNSKRVPPPMPQRQVPATQTSAQTSPQYGRQSNTLDRQSEGLPAIPTSGPINHVGEGFVDLDMCRVQLISEVDVPAQESGPLVTSPVTEGQQVTAKQVLANIDNKVAKLRLETAQTKYDAANQKAINDIDIRAASNALQLADRERKRNWPLMQKGTIAKAEYDRSALQAKQAELQLEQARRDRDAAVKEALVESFNVKAANESISRHIIESPINGIVMERYKQPGEWVNAGDNVVRLARMDRLHVQGFLNSNLFNPHEVQGKDVTISVPVARGQTMEFTGRIVFVSFKKASANSFVIKAEVENRLENGRWMLLANEEARMRIHVGQTATQANRWQQNSLR